MVATPPLPWNRGADGALNFAQPITISDILNGALLLTITDDQEPIDPSLITFEEYAVGRSEIVVKVNGERVFTLSPQIGGQRFVVVYAAIRNNFALTAVERQEPQPEPEPEVQSLTVSPATPWQEGRGGTFNFNLPINQSFLISDGVRLTIGSETAANSENAYFDGSDDELVVRRELDDTILWTAELNVGATILFLTPSETIGNWYLESAVLA